MKVKLSIVTVRDGRSGEMYDKEAILNQGEPIMARSKVRVDIGFRHNDDTPLTPEERDELVDPGSIHWEFGVNGKPDLSFDGDEDSTNFDGVWQLRKQGLKQLKRTKGHTTVVSMTGYGFGTTSGYIRVIGPDGSKAQIDVRLD